MSNIISIATAKYTVHGQVFPSENRTRSQRLRHGVVGSSNVAMGTVLVSHLKYSLEFTRLYQPVASEFSIRDCIIFILVI